MALDVLRTACVGCEPFIEHVIEHIGRVLPVGGVICSIDHSLLAIEPHYRWARDACAIANNYYFNALFVQNSNDQDLSQQIEGKTNKAQAIKSAKR